MSSQHSLRYRTLWHTLLAGALPFVHLCRCSFASRALRLAYYCLLLV